MDQIDLQRAGQESVPVYFVIVPGCLLLDVAGPAEALRMANSYLEARGRARGFALHYVAPSPESQSSVGLPLLALESLPERIADNAWVIIPGGSTRRFAPALPEDMKILRWLRSHFPSDTRPLITICAGALYAGGAGLLDGLPCTTHHDLLGFLREVAPLAEVVDNRVFVEAGQVASSAGVTAGIDLALYLISRHVDPVCAAAVARNMVMYLRRGPDDPEISPFLAHRNHMHAAVHRVQDAVSANPRNKWHADEMARVACVSPRHLGRLFADHAGISPHDYVQSIRVAVANQALDAGMSVEQAAEAAGFGSDRQLRRARQQHAQAGEGEAG